MQRDFLPGVPEAVGMCSERLGRISTMLAAFCRLKIQKAGKLVYDETFNGPLGTVTDDTIYRYYSQTKILTTAVVMLAVERGLLRLDDPVEMYIPEFANMTVYVSGSVGDDTVETVPAESPPTIRQCVMHIAGFGYGGLSAPLLEDEVDRIYATNNLSIFNLIAGGAGKHYGTLEKLAAKIGTVPLRHQPGAQWDYALGHIVAGRCVEVVMGRTLTEIMQTEVFDPLAMTTATWGVKANDPNLLPEFGYGTVEQVPGKPWTLKQRDPVASPPMPGLEAQMGTLLLPDVQMCGKAEDWWKLFACLSSNGRAMTGYQLLAPRSVELMMTSQLPGGALLPDIGSPFAKQMGMAAEATAGGVGFGLGGWVTVNAQATGGLIGPPPGVYSWGGAAGTRCVIDSSTDLGWLFYTQQLMSSQRETSNMGRGALDTLIYASILEPSPRGAPGQSPGGGAVAGSVPSVGVQLSAGGSSNVGAKKMRWTHSNGRSRYPRL